MTDNTTSGKSAKEFTGRHMTALMLLFFGVIMVVNFTMAWLARDSWTGLVVKNSYVASQQFNGQLAQARAQARRGWQSHLSYADGVIRFKLANRSGQPIEIGDLEIAVGRPAFEQLDVKLSLARVSAGTYLVRHRLAPGTWAVRIEGGAGNRRFRRDDRLFVSKSASKSDG